MEEIMVRPEITGRKIGGRKLESREQEAEAETDEADEPPDEADEAARIAGKKLLTFDDLVALGHPYTRLHTKRLEDANVFPKRVKPGGEASNFVCWFADEYFAYLKALAAARTKPAKADGKLKSLELARGAAEDARNPGNGMKWHPAKRGGPRPIERHASPERVSLLAS
jgi:hypothetical protein